MPSPKANPTLSTRQPNGPNGSLSVTLEVGVKVYHDTLPGIGWVLDREGYPKRYLATKELAVARWETLRPFRVS